VFKFCSRRRLLTVLFSDGTRKGRFEMQEILINKKISIELEKKIADLADPETPVRFAIVGDLTLDSQY
jgi:hypothetical protein